MKMFDNQTLIRSANDLKRLTKSTPEHNLLNPLLLGAPKALKKVKMEPDMELRRYSYPAAWPE
jgi:hypothetical protein